MKKLIYELDKEYVYTSIYIPGLIKEDYDKIYSLYNEELAPLYSEYKEDLDFYGKEVVHRSQYIPYDLDIIKIASNLLTTLASSIIDEVTVLIPIDTGMLLRSLYVKQLDDLSIAIGCDTSVAPYAPYVHEIYMHHDGIKTDHFLLYAYANAVASTGINMFNAHIDVEFPSYVKAEDAFIWTGQKVNTLDRYSGGKLELRINTEQDSLKAFMPDEQTASPNQSVISMVRNAIETITSTNDSKLYYELLEAAKAEENIALGNRKHSNTFMKSINKNNITPSDEVMDMIDRNKDVYYGQIFRATLMNSNLQMSLAKISKELGKSTRKAFRQTHLSKYIK